MFARCLLALLFLSTTSLVLSTTSLAAPAQQVVQIGVTAGDGVAIRRGARYRLQPLSQPAMTPFGRSCALDMDGDLMEDHAVIVDGTVRLLFAPGLFEAPVADVQSQVLDVERLPGRTSLRDSLLTAGPLGVRAYRWVDGALVERQVLDDPCRCVVAVPRPPAVPRRVLVLLQDGVTVLEATEVSENGREAWATSVYHVHKEHVQEIAVADLGGDGVLDLCLRVKKGIHLIDRNGEVWLNSTFPSMESRAMAVVGPPGREQWLTAVIEYTLTGQELIAVYTDQGLIDLEIVGGDVGFVGLAGADVSPKADGRFDINLTWETTYDVATMHDVGLGQEPPVFDVGLSKSIAILETGEPPPTAPHTAWPEVVDVDNDGDADTIFPIQEDGSIFVYLGEQIDESRQKPRILQDETLSFRLGPTIELHMNVEADPQAIPFGAANAFEIIVYHRPSPDDPVDTDPVFSDVVPLEAAPLLSGGRRHFPCVVPLLDVPVDGGCTTFDSMYWVVVRLVRIADGPLGPDPRVLQRFPARLYGIEGQAGDDANSTFIEDHAPPGLQALFIPHECPDAASDPTLPSSGHDVVNSESGGSGKELPCLPGPMDEKKVPVTKQTN